MNLPVIKFCLFSFVLRENELKEEDDDVKEVEAKEKYTDFARAIPTNRFLKSKQGTNNDSHLLKMYFFFLLLPIFFSCMICLWATVRDYLYNDRAFYWAICF